MNRENIAIIIKNLEHAYANYEKLLREYILKNKTRIIGYVFPLVPPEITSSFGIESVKLPEEFISGKTPIPTDKPLYEAVVLPGIEMPCCTCSFNQIPLFRINYPGGYGEDAAVSLHNETSAMLNSLFNIDLKSIDISVLQSRTAVFENLRRSVRSIVSLNQERTGGLTSEELDLIFEVSSIFPADMALDLIHPLLEEILKIQPEQNRRKTKALIYGARKIPTEILEYIESRGIAVAEDDTCSGRRLFDISLNVESEYLFYELLDAYSYRPMSPCTRGAAERYELLYRLLRNYGINLLIFYRDDVCGLSSDDISYLRIRMMRDGIDPLVIDSENYTSEIDNYTGRMQLSP